MVEYIVAIDVTRVRFPADAFLLNITDVIEFDSILLFIVSDENKQNVKSPVV